MDVSKLMDVKNKMIELENNGDEDMINLKTFLMYEVRRQSTMHCSSNHIDNAILFRLNQ